MPTAIYQKPTSIWSSNVNDAKPTSPPIDELPSLLERLKAKKLPCPTPTSG